MAETQQPDILFILADDLGYADLSCYGRRDFVTPHIDSLARDGMKFTQAYANSAICSPTRTALITGRYQGRLEVGLDEPYGLRKTGLPAEHPTLPSLLKRQGYQTALVGKWHLGYPPDFGPQKSGYDTFYGIRSGGADYFRHQKELWEEDVLANETGYLTELLGGKAVSTIKQLSKSSSPYFMSLHFTAPHWPWLGPQDQAESERLASIGPGSAMHYDGGSQRTYAAMMKSLDEQVGRVLAAIEATGRARNTIVIFTSDNGGERFADTWPLSGKKGELLEGGLRVPVLVRWPAQVAAGRESDQTNMSMDWLPTLVAAAGTEPDRDYPSDGMNLLPQLTKGASAAPRKLFWRYNSLAQEAVRAGDWKYLKILGNTFLFNVVEDPLERANLKRRFPDVAERLAKDWQEWNQTMLPYTEANSSWTFSARDLADHFGAPGWTMPKRPS